MDDFKVDAIGKDFTFGQLLKFVALPIISRLIISLLQTIDDGLFLSRYCGTDALAAFSIGLPLFMLSDGIGMLVSGITVSCSTKMGEKKKEAAMADFTTMSVVAFVLGIVASALIWIFKEQIMNLLGCTEILRPYLSIWLDVMKFNLPFSLTTYIFNRFYVIAGKPKFSAAVALVHTISNFALDYIFIVRMNMGIKGTALANLIGNILVVVIGLFFYSDKKKEMHFSKINKDILATIKESIKFGKVDAFTSIALAVNSYISNRVLLSLSNEDFVAAFTIVNNVQFLFMAGFFGLFGATNPIISYAFGEKKKDKLVKIIKQNAIITLLLAVIICMVYLVCKNQILDIYMIAGQSDDIKSLASAGMNVTPFAFYFFAYNIMVQFVALALNNDKASSILTFIENVIASNLTTIALPYIFGVRTSWYAFLCAEIITSIASTVIVIKCADKYGYGKKQIATEIEK